MEKGITYVGLDVHKDSIAVAALMPGEPQAIQWSTRNDATAVRQLVGRLRRQSGPQIVRCCYEAGPCGYGIQRLLQTQGVECTVIAPSLTPRKPGDRIKTDRRDARKLAELFRAGLLTEVHPPTPAQEAVRDLCRCREDAKRDLQRARRRLAAMLLRKGVRFHMRKSWTVAFRSWLAGVRFDDLNEQTSFEDYVLGIEQLEERVKRLDQAIDRAASEEAYRERVGWLRCLRGVDTLTAMVILTELHDTRRFDSPRQLAAFLGLVPSEHSSADRVFRGRITKTGNTHLRRLLVESSWAYKKSPGVSAYLRRRRDGQPTWALALADKAQQRLHQRYWHLSLRGKPSAKATIAVARELVGFIWAILQGPAGTLVSN